MDIYNKISSRIIQEQEIIVGSLAWQIAEKVTGLAVVNKQTYQISIAGEPKNVINDLVSRYEKVFGAFANDVCKHSVAYILANLPAEDIPANLE